MSDAIRNETQVGLAELKRRFSSAGLSIFKQQRNTGFQRSTYFAVGSAERQTDITISDTFLDDLPNTSEYQAKVDSYALAVAGRIKCGSPEVFYCRSGIAVGISIRWPIQVAPMGSGPAAFILMDVTNQIDGQIAKCSMRLGFSFNHTVFETLPETIYSVRLAIDAGLLRFFKADVRQEIYQ